MVSAERTSRRTSQAASPLRMASAEPHRAQRPLPAASNQIMQRKMIQAKLTVSQPGDPSEREADRIAAAVIQKPVLDARTVGGTNIQPVRIGIQRFCPHCEEELHRQPVDGTKVDEELEREAEQAPDLQRSPKTEDSSGGSGLLPDASFHVPQTAGHPLQQPVLNFMGQRFGHDFNSVRVHTDGAAVQSARQLKAYAYTVGRHIYFNAGQYNPSSFAGQRLLAHELTHVVQQSHLQRSPESSAGSPPDYFVQPCSIPAYCPPDFCRPFPSRRAAIRDRDNPPDPNASDLDAILFLAQQLLGGSTKADVLLRGIALRVDPRVVSLWREHIFGGRGPQNLSSSFGADFTNSATTANTTRFLLGELRTRLQRHPPRFPRRHNTVNLSLRRLIRAAIREIGNPTSPNSMNFNVINEVPGNIAGGIGRDQLSCRVGARPSPFNDSRTATGTVQVTRNPDGSLTATPSITYVVRDTIDLCPGDCGADQEQLATVPISRWEASRISGDVPFTVRFPAPPTSPMTIPPTGPSIGPGP